MRRARPTRSAETAAAPLSRPRPVFDSCLRIVWIGDRRDITSQAGRRSGRSSGEPLIQSRRDATFGGLPEPVSGGHRGWTGHGMGSSDRPSGRVPRRRLVRDTGALFRPYSWAVAFIGLVVFFTAGVGVVNPLLIKVVFDTALFP